jgi:hypothetical protein
MKHLDTPEIVDFVTGKSDRKQALKAKQHIDVCPECSMRVKAHHYIRNNFDEVWTDWTSSRRIPGESLADRVSLALSRGLENPRHHDLTKRMEVWLKRVRADAGIAWCAAVSSVGKAARVVRESLEELSPLVSDLALQPVAVHTGIKTLGAVQTSSGPKTLRTRGATTLQATLSVERSKTPQGNRIRVKSSPLQEPWPLVMLFPEAGGVPVFSEFRKARNQLVADFKDLPDVQYMVVVEGRAKKKTSLPKRRTS